MVVKEEEEEEEEERKKEIPKNSFDTTLFHFCSSYFVEEIHH
jgi:hypothetical protein